jgi:hypothetical protein
VFTSNIDPQAFFDNSPHFLNLTGTVRNDRIVVQSPNLGEDEFIIVWFAAECAVAAADTRTWVDIDILVNNVSSHRLTRKITPSARPMARTLILG